MRTLLLALLLCAWASTPRAELLPQWEFGFGATAFTLPDYRGSDERRGYLFPLPFVVYRGEKVRVDRQGFRGLRFNFMRHLGSGPKIEDVIALGSRLAPLEMHLQLHFESSLIHEIAPWLRKSAVPVMIDHMGRMDASRGVDQPDFRALLDLMEDRRILIKVSGSERCTRQAPPYRDAVPLAAKLVAEFGHRTFWGTDWPHPNLDHVPDDGDLADLLSEIAPTEAQRQALLVDNPRRFYRYLPASA